MQPAYIYLKFCSELNLYKIGVSKNLKQRNSALQTGNPYEIETLFNFLSSFPYRVETSLHKKLQAYKTDVNNTKLKGEWFNLTNDQVDNFYKDCQQIEQNIKFLIDSGNHFILK